MTLPKSSLRAFSAALLSLAEVARTAPPRRLMHDALQALRPLIAFRSAWWGECSDTDPAAATTRQTWLHGRINLSASFAREWNALAAEDSFASESMDQLGQVVRSTGHDGLSPAVEAFSRRHALDHAMAITVELPGSGLMFFVSLYRPAEMAHFDDTESVLFTEFARHLLQHWRVRVQQMLLASPPGASDALGLVDAHGELHYLGARLGRCLQAQWPGWSGSTLPAELAGRLREAPCVVALGSERLTLQACGELLVLSLDRGGRTATLPPRERSAAMLYAQGHSYKAIARMLGLSPATVRTYLRSVYLQLGVRNKIELGDALNG